MDTLELLNIIISKFIKRQVTRAKVLSIDTGDQTCEVETLQGSSKRFEVKLRAIADGEETGLILYPKVDSIVLIGILDNNENDCFIAKYSELEGMQYVIKDKTKLKSTSDGKWYWKATTEIFFDGCSNGLIKIPSVVSKLNALENKVNALIAAHNAHQHPETGATTGLPTLTVPGTLTNTTQSDVRHDKIEF